MSDIAKRARFEVLRSLGFASISDAYTAIGSALENAARLAQQSSSNP